MSKERIRVEVEVQEDGHAHHAYADASDIKRLVLEVLRDVHDRPPRQSLLDRILEKLAAHMGCTKYSLGVRHSGPVTASEVMLEEQEKVDQKRSVDLVKAVRELVEVMSDDCDTMKTRDAWAKVKSLLPAEPPNAKPEWHCARCNGVVCEADRRLDLCAWCDAEVARKKAPIFHQCEKCQSMNTTFHEGLGWLCEEHVPPSHKDAEIDWHENIPGADIICSCGGRVASVGECETGVCPNCDDEWMYEVVLTKQTDRDEKSPDLREAAERVVRLRPHPQSWPNFAKSGFHEAISDLEKALEAS